MTNLANRGQIGSEERREMAQVIGAKLPRERRRTAHLMATLPAGITIGERRDGREKPFYVRFGKDRLTESFAKERDRNDRAQELGKSLKTEGTGVLEFDPSEWRDLKAFKERIGVSIEEAEAIVNQVRGNLKLNLTVEDAVKKYQALRADEGLSGDSLSHMELHLDRFVREVPSMKALGALPLFTIGPDRIREWMAALKQAHGFGPITLRHHRKSVHMFFERALIEKWTFENPCRAVVPPKVDDGDVTVMAPQAIFKLLKVNRDLPVVGRIVLELFGALRCSSVERIKEEHIRWKARGIEMPGKKHKTGKRKFRQGQPAVLWAWLEHATPACWTEITEKNYDEQKRDAFVRAGVQNPGNVLRHSFASYLLAVKKDLAHVSYQMQHTSLKMTEKYEGVAEEDDGKLVMAMTPSAVLLSWDEFVRQNQPAPK